MIGPNVFTSVINHYLPEPNASLLNGILFGVPVKTSRVFYEQLKAVGLLHIVVLSGMNITILSTIIMYVTRSFGKKLSLAISILGTVIFIIFVGPQAPIVRAGIMGILTSVSLSYGRRTHGLYMLLLSALVIMVIKPLWLTTISFQLSYGATCGIMLFGPYSYKKQSALKGRMLQAVVKDMRTSIAAQLFTTPIIFLYFKQISLLAPISNLLVSFLIAPLMIAGFLCAVLGKIHWSLGLLPSYFAYGLTHYMVFIIESLSKIPFSFIQFSPKGG